MSRVFRGAGGGGGDGGGGGGRAAVTAPDTLSSIQYASVLDLVSEGEIEGLVNGYQSIYLDDTPLQNPDGTMNFNGFTVDTRNGATVQDVIPGFPATESASSVSVEVHNGIPVTRQVLNENVDAIRINLATPQLFSQNNENGDVNGSTIQFKIEVQPSGGSFTPVIVGRAYESVGYVANAFSLECYGFSVSAAFTHATSTLQMQDLEGGWTNVSEELPMSYVIEYKTPGASSWSTMAAGNLAPGVNVAAAETAEGSFGTWWCRVTATGGSVASVSASKKVDSYTGVISGKCSSRYNRNYTLPLTGSGPWNIRVSKLTGESDSYNSRDLWWDSITEIIDVKLSYPNSALVGLTIDSSQFASIPSRAYDLRGIRVKVPSNYFPTSRKYTRRASDGVDMGTVQIWDGTFYVAWSDNPAWCFYDLLTNARYGLGEFVNDYQVDKGNLYSIAQYCDELVPNGFGGTEPRFTCNMYLQTREEAFKVLSDMAGLFAGMLFWASGGLSCTQDAPDDAVYQFTNANVISGNFTYNGSSRNVRHTTALVSYNDPNDKFTRKVEYVEDTEGILKYGVRQAELVAIGCTSRGQAHRMGKRILLTERMLTEVVTFRVSLEYARCYPGAIIDVMDNDRVGARLGGRVRAATTTSVTLDAPVTLDAGESYILTIIKPDGAPEERGVIVTPGSTQTLTPTIPFSTAPTTQSVWTLSGTAVDLQKFKVTSIKELENLNFEVTALQYNPSKYNAIDYGLKFEPLNTSLRPNAMVADPVTNLKLSEELFMVTPSVVGTRATISWSGQAIKYYVNISGNNQNPISAEVYTSTYAVDNLAPGRYTVSVVAVNALGRPSSPTTITAEVYGKLVHPAPVSGLALAAISSLAHVTWQASADLDVLVGGSLRIKHLQPGQTVDWNNGVDVGQAIAGTATSATLPLMAGTYMAKWVDSSGFESDTIAYVTTDAPNIINMNFVTSLSEDPGFTGAKVNTVLTTFLGQPAITLDSLLTVDEMTTLIDSWGMLNVLGGGVKAAGEYYFANAVDLGAVMTSRLTAAITAYGYDSADNVDSWVAIDDLLSIDGTAVSDTYAALQVRTTNVDPASNVWGSWCSFFVGDWTARAFQFRLLLTRDTLTHNIAVTNLDVTVDMPDRLESGDDISSPAGGLTVNFSQPFYAVPAIGITAQGMASGDYYSLSKSASSFTIQFFNSSNASISRTFDYIARSY